MTILRKKRVYAILLILLMGLLYYNSNWIGRWLYPIYYKPDILVSSKNHEVDPFLIAAIIRVETNYKTDQVSKKGAVGIMQLMPDTAKWIIEKRGLTSVTLQDVESRPDISIELGTWYLQWLHKQFEGNRAAVIASYNAGQGNVKKWIQNGVWDGKLESVDKVPFGETRHYVQRVIYYYNKYTDIYSDFE